ncbi:MAG: acyl-CoA dehydrogenase [Myxococcota bacterium]
MDTDLLDLLLTADPQPQPTDSIDGWMARHRDAPPLETAIRGGFAADRLGYAFASGYQAACRALLPDAPAGWLLALCATESGGGHPRAIQTALSQGRLTGDKRFVSMGTLAQGLIVVARTGEADGRPQLKAALVDATGEGVTVTAQPALPFIPEIPHATLSLRDVTPERVLSGDGYTRVLKPFRTIEDTFVHAALIAHLIGIGRRSGWDAQTIEALLASLCGLSALARLDPGSQGVHRALGGILARFEALMASLDFSRVEDATRQRWVRDSPLLQLAGRTRAARLASARQGHRQR